MGILLVSKILTAVTLFMFFSTSSLFVYANYSACLYSAFKTGTPRKCYWLGWGIIIGTVSILLWITYLLSKDEEEETPETFVNVISSKGKSAADQARPTAIGNLGREMYVKPSHLKSVDELETDATQKIHLRSIDELESFSPTSGLKKSHRLGDANI